MRGTSPIPNTKFFTISSSIDQHPIPVSTTNSTSQLLSLSHHISSYTFSSYDIPPSLPFSKLTWLISPHLFYVLVPLGLTGTYDNDVVIYLLNTDAHLAFKISLLFNFFRWMSSVPAYYSIPFLNDFWLTHIFTLLCLLLLLTSPSMRVHSNHACQNYNTNI
jgi:hypothetical protein